jgi:hypothetical protein
MFERNKVDNSLQQTTVPVEMTLEDGEVLKGKIIMAASRSIYEVLNGETKFIDFETYQGKRSLIAKAQLKSLEILPVPSSAGLKNRLRDGDQFDPYMVLGVPSSATFEEIKAAYHKLSKIYHPDKFAAVELPNEVREYLAAMSRRINAAYMALEAPFQANKRAEIVKAKPVFVSPQRF